MRLPLKLGILFPYFAAAASMLGCILFFRFYLTQTSNQFTSDFLSQNLTAISTGDSYQVARQLNSLSSSVQWVCISAFRDGTPFFQRENSSNCKAGYWQKTITVPDDNASSIKIRFTLTLPDVLKRAEIGFVAIQLAILWSLFIRTRSMALNEERNRHESQQKFFEFAQQIAHDIRGPLSALNAVAASMSPHDERAQLVRSVSKRINGIAEGLLPFKVKLPQASTQTLASLATISELIAEVLAEKQVVLKKNLSLSFSSRQLENAHVFIDTTAFQRVVAILIENAIEATEQGEIELLLECQNDHLRFSVSDPGKGIPEELVPKLFVEGSTFGKLNGNGLGLRYAKNCIEDWSGRIEISSVLNVGTTILCVIPSRPSDNG